MKSREPRASSRRDRPPPEPGPLAALAGPPALTPPVSTLPGALDRLASLDAPWLTFHVGAAPSELTAQDAFRLAGRWAAALLAAGVDRGDRVILLLPNGPDFVGAFFGAHLAGVVPVPVAWPFFPEPAPRRVAALAPVLAAARPKAVLTTGDYAGGGWPCPALTAPADHPAPLPSVDATQPAFIQFTSGTTGPGKGAVISQGAAVYNAWAIGHALGLGEGDTGLSWLPLFHDMGLVGALLTSLLYGFRLHLMRPGDFLLRPDRWPRLLSETGATLAVGPNFAFDLAAKKTRQPELLSLAGLRHALNGSEPVHRSTVERFTEAFAPAGLAADVVRPVYGLAENTLAVAFGLEREEDLTWHQRAVPTVGRPLAGMEVELRGPDGAVVPEGVEGEITVKSPSLATGYFEAPEQTARALRDGWLHTGDLGVIQGGRLYVTGREKDLIFKGGQKVYPYEIEAVLAAEEDVPPGGVAAFAMPDASDGADLLVVAMELKSRSWAGAEQRVRGRLVEALGLRPDRVAIVAPGALPRTTSGKVRRAACRALVEAM
ncbi:MAG: AMP-binding protein [Deltaproteobacteria bacterium]|nr:AMP-binding protein [Deltaproteobacteria bacterium]